MTRSQNDWKKSGRSHVDDTLDGLYAELNDHLSDISDEINALRNEAFGDDPNESVLEERTDALTDSLIGLSHASLDRAADVRGLRSGSTFRQLRGEEPIGYSKRDGGATHDVFYGMKSMNKSFNRNLHWPLQLHEWNKETADQPPTKHPETGERIRAEPGDISPVTAEGTKKYTKRIGGRTVHVVIDERGMSPI